MVGKAMYLGAPKLGGLGASEILSFRSRVSTITQSPPNYSPRGIQERGI